MHDYECLFRTAVCKKRFRDHGAPHSVASALRRRGVIEVCRRSGQGDLEDPVDGLPIPAEGATPVGQGGVEGPRSHGAVEGVDIEFFVVSTENLPVVSVVPIAEALAQLPFDPTYRVGKKALVRIEGLAAATN